MPDKDDPVRPRKPLVALVSVAASILLSAAIIVLSALIRVRKING